MSNIRNIRNNRAAMQGGPIQAQVKRGRKTLAAFVLAGLLTGLPVLATNLPAPVSNFLLPTAQAGCPTGGTCG